MGRLSTISKGIDKDQMTLFGGAGKGTRHSHSDISVKYGETSQNGSTVKRITIYFRNGKDKKIGDRFDMASNYGCIIFIPNKYGTYKYYAGKNQSYIGFTKKVDVDLLMEFCGDYDLQFDKNNGHYYISKFAKKEEANG